MLFTLFKLRQKHYVKRVRVVSIQRAHGRAALNDSFYIIWTATRFHKSSLLRPTC